MSAKPLRLLLVGMLATVISAAVILIGRSQVPAQSEYVLGPEDVIEIVVWSHGDLIRRPEPEYEIGPGDSVEVAVWPQTEFSRMAVVRPDGAISFPPIGELEVFGLTPKRLAERLTEGLRPLARTPRVTVVVAGMKVSRPNVIEIFGRSRTVPIRFDGKVGLPVLGDVDVGGMTPEQAADRIAAGLGNHVGSPRVTVLVKEFKGKKVSILGQVGTPGQYKLREPALLVEAIAMAGGTTFAARLKEVVVITGNPDSQRTITVDLERVLKGQDARGNLLLQPNDVVFVPGTLEEAVDGLRKNAPNVQVQIQVPGR